eukprot:1194245-Prorocentrum_minimum.AAC.6
MTHQDLTLGPRDGNELGAVVWEEHRNLVPARPFVVGSLSVAAAHAARSCYQRCDGTGPSPKTTDSNPDHLKRRCAPTPWRRLEPEERPAPADFVGSLHYDRRGH